MGGPVTAVRLSPDGTRLAVTSRDFSGAGVIRLFDTRGRRLLEVQLELPLDAGRRVRWLVAPGRFVDVASPVFSPDSRVLAADIAQVDTSFTTVRGIARWDARRGRRLGLPQPLTSPVITASAAANTPALAGFTAGGAEVVSSSAADGRTTIRDRRGARTVRTFPVGGRPAAVSPDGRFIALTGRSGPVRVLDLHTGRLRVLGDRAADAVAFTRHGRLVTTGRGAPLEVWDARNATPVRTVAPAAAGVLQLAVAPNGDTAYGVGKRGSLVAWDLTGRRGLGRPLRLPVRGSVAIAGPETGAPLIAVAAAASGVELLDTVKRAVAGRIAVRGRATAVSLTPDGRTLAVGTSEGAIGFADVRARRMLGPLQLSHVNPVRAVAFSPDGRRLATTDGSVLFLWDVRRRRTLSAFQAFGGVATTLAFSPDGQVLAVADSPTQVPTRAAKGPGALDVISVPQLRLLRQTAVSVATQVMFSHSGDVLFLADRAGRVWLLDTRSWKPLGAPLDANATRFALDPHDRLLATASSRGDVQLWDVPLGRPLGGALPGLPHGPVHVAFADRGSALAVLRGDGRGMLWDVRPSSWERRACAIAGRTLTRAEWREALPELGYAPSCARHR
jgi:WD40 repeat protein